MTKGGKYTQQYNPSFANFPHAHTGFRVLANCIMGISVWEIFRTYLRCENVCHVQW